MLFEQVQILSSFFGIYEERKKLLHYSDVLLLLYRLISYNSNGTQTVFIFIGLTQCGAPYKLFIHIFAIMILLKRNILSVLAATTEQSWSIIS